MKKFKGVTLVEVIVAMFIFALACLILVQIYLSVNSINSENHKYNSSLAQQMKYAEALYNEGDEAVELKYNKATESGNKVNSGEPHITIRNKWYEKNNVGDRQPILSAAQFEYKYGCNVYILENRDMNDATSDGGGAYLGDDASPLRYKYLIVE